jgi:serine/threonine protein kinase
LEPLPGYRLRLRRGGSAVSEVWEADGPGGERVALKFLPRERGTSVEARALDLVRDLNFDDAVRVDRLTVAPDAVVVAMELADGSLADLLQAYQNELGTAVPFDSLTEYLLQAAEALDRLNARKLYEGGQLVGVQHCSVKPSNLLLFGERIKLGDFARAATAGQNLTPHALEGPAAFAAPEQLRGYLSERSDQFALALTYFVLRTGAYPFGEMPDEFAAVTERPRPDLSALPEAERAVVRKGLAPQPKDRWLSCGMMMRELVRCGGDSLPAETQAARDTHADFELRSTSTNLPRKG